MNISIPIALLIFCPLFLNCQLFDTIPHWQEGLMVIEKSENARIDSLVEANGGIMFRANYIIIDSTGKQIGKSVFHDLEEYGTLELKSKFGVKSSEQIFLKNSTLTKLYYESGNVKLEENSHYINGVGFTETRIYYDNELNSIKEMETEIRVQPEEYKGIIIDEWRIDVKYRMETLIVEQEVNDSLYLPNDYIEFHPNGRIKEIGNYLKRTFWEFRNEEYYKAWLNEGIDMIDNYAAVLQRRVRVKDGEWKYYDENGNLERTEFYKDGLMTQ